MDGTWSSFPTWAIVAVALLAVVEIVLDVVALVDLYRRPIDQVVAGNKWVWLILILFVNIIGAIIYLAAGRKRPSAMGDAATASSASQSPEGVADALYGPPDEDAGRPDGGGD